MTVAVITMCITTRTNSFYPFTKFEQIETDVVKLPAFSVEYAPPDVIQYFNQHF